MKLRTIGALLSAVIAAIAVASPAAAVGVSSRDLVRNPPGTGLDGAEIVFEGEAIQQVMFRGDYGWVNVRDDANAVGVWMPRGELARIGLTGAYGRVGDRIRVTGVFHAACPQHGGDLDIHGKRLEIASRGRVQRERVRPSSVLGACTALAVALVLVWAAKRREREAV